jgi:acyl carrier protein
VSPDAVTFDTSFLAHLGMDALDLAGLNALVEEAFGIHIPEGEAGAIKTIADAIRYIEKHRGKGQPPQPLGFAPGDRVRVCDGTFLGQEGEVTSLRERYGMVTVRLEMYGRPVPVELEAWQIALVAD